MKVVSAAVMRELDAKTIAAGTPGEVLMERAGQGAFIEISRFILNCGVEHFHRVLILTGKGNNGGDGYVIARLFSERTELPVTVISVCPRENLRDAALLHAQRVPDKVVFLACSSIPDTELVPGTLVVDCLLGTGISGAVRSPFAEIIKTVNQSGLPVAAIDIPSGVNSDTGAVEGEAIQADITLTMGVPKAGLLRGAGAALCGLLRVVDIGIPPALVAACPAEFEAVTQADAAALVRRIPTDTHKGDRGRILIAGGSFPYPGAPFLAARAALRSGAGLVSVAYPASMGHLLHPRANAPILIPLGDDGCGWHQKQADSLISDLLHNQHVVVLGPGLGSRETSLEFAVQLLQAPIPLVLDADGLRALSLIPTLLPRPATTVLTPHPGEMRRLLEAYDRQDLLTADRQTQATEIARQTGAILVLKGRHTIIAAPDGERYVNASGSPALATAGSGDVLTGMIAAFLVDQENPMDAVRLAVYLHGLAGEKSPNGQRALMADDLIDLIGPTLKELSPFA